MPDELFWRLTVDELDALLEAIAEREAAQAREAALRAGLIAASIYNANPFRKKGARALKPTDFIREPPRQMTAKQLEHALDRWAGAINRGRT